PTSRTGSQTRARSGSAAAPSICTTVERCELPARGAGEDSGSSVMTGRLRDVSGALGRLVEISALAALHAARLGARIVRSAFTGSGPSAGVLLGEALADLCQSLGPTFIKVGQILSARPDLVPSAVAGTLARLQDGVPPFNAREIPRLVEQALGRPL